jgi:hypothetical protein
MKLLHITHAHLAEADVATASRQQSVTRVHCERRIIGGRPLSPES